MPDACTAITEDDLKGLLIPGKVAQRAVPGMSDEAWYAALERKDIPATRIGRRYFVHGAPFRRMLGLEPAGSAA